LNVAIARLRSAAVNRRTLVRGAWTIAFALLALLFLKTFVCDVKHVDSGSMEPFIFGAEDGGESVLVWYDSSPPVRFESVVILRGGETTPIVKRVVGIAGESVQISNGDLLIDNHRLPPDAPRPPPVVVFDDRWQRVEDAFGMGGTKGNPWTREGAAWNLDATKIAHGEQTGLMYLLANVHDDYLAPDHSLVRGKESVNDLVLECEVRADEAHGDLRFMLTEQGDTFELAIHIGEHGDAEIALTRRADVEEALDSARVPFAANAWHRVRFSNIDNALRAELDGRAVFAPRVYKENHIHPHDSAHEGKSFPHRVYLGGDEGKFSFRSIRVLRDLYYTQRGRFGVEGPAELGPDEYFVLGDNSSESRDSREWGPVHASEILGRPVFVVWPPGHIRKLPSVARADSDASDVAGR
jgi:signal peptidase I